MMTFPLYRILPDGRCACGDRDCKDVGKHPRQYQWQKLTESVPHQDGEGYGVVTGSASGVFVVDCDVKDGKNGLEALATLVGDREWPDTYEVLTGGGGAHFYFRLPAGVIVRNSKSKLGVGIDIRGEGGFVVGAGSRHVSGRAYETVNAAEPAEAPRWLVEKLLALSAPVQRAATVAAPKPVDLESVRGKECAARFEKTMLTWPPAISGQNGHTTLLNLCQKAVRSYELPLDYALERIMEVYNERCQPPWSEREVQYKLEEARDDGMFTVGDVPPNPAWNRFAKMAPEEWAASVEESAKAKKEKKEYSHEPGNAPAGELVAKPISDLIGSLVSDDDWIGVWRRDVFANRIVAINPPCELDAETIGFQKNDVTVVRTWFETRGVKAKKEDIADAIEQAAAKCKWHPVRDYLDNLPKRNNSGLLEQIATRCLGVNPEEQPRAVEFVTKWIIGAVKRIYEPGCKMQYALILVGEPGAFKSTFAEVLFSSAWFSDQINKDLSDKAASSDLMGKWCIEFSELASMSRNELEITKAFLSRRVDHYTPKYQTHPIDVPRQCVFFGTTNDDTPLKDATGDRRWLPIRVTAADMTWLSANRDAIWAEARDRARAGESHWFSDVKAVEADKDSFVEHDPWHEEIENYCIGRTHVRVADIHKTIDKDGLKSFTTAVKKRISDTLRRLGCKQVKHSDGGKQYRCWEVPARLASMKRSVSPVSSIEEAMKRKAAQQ